MSGPVQILFGTFRVLTYRCPVFVLFGGATLAVERERSLLCLEPDTQCRTREDINMDFGLKRTNRNIND